MNRFFTSCCALLSGLAVVFTLGACDSLTDLNDNPNASGDAQISYLLTNAQTGLAQRTYSSFTLGRFSNNYAQYWAPTQYVDEARFGFPTERPGANQNIWDSYFDMLNDLKRVKEVARNNPERASAYGDPADVQAIAMIQQAWIWQTLTDLYGPIPFTQALQSRENFQPSYTPQDSIYMAVAESLQTAQGMITGERALEAADVIFGGDTEQWQAFANTLQMRFAIRAAEASDQASAWFQRAYEQSSFSDLDGYQNAVIPFASSSPYQNPIYVNEVVNGRGDFAVSRTLTNQMNEIGDPRRSAYARRTPDDQPNSQGYQGQAYNGIPYGVTSGQLSEYGDFSVPGERVAYIPDGNAILLQESQEYFMIAEAAQRGWIDANAADNYEEGIRASLAYWGVEDGVEDFIESVPYDNSNGWAPAATGDTPTWVQTLGTQKWLSLYMQGFAGWAEFLRLDFDNVFYLPPASDNASAPISTGFGQPFPVRLPYPNDEASLNTMSYNDAVSNLLSGPDNQGAFLWWDDGNFGDFAGIAGQGG